jgi:hypothetical protein
VRSGCGNSGRFPRSAVAGCRRYFRTRRRRYCRAVGRPLECFSRQRPAHGPQPLPTSPGAQTGSPRVPLPQASGAYGLPASATSGSPTGSRLCAECTASRDRKNPWRLHCRELALGKAPDQAHDRRLSSLCPPCFNERQYRLTEEEAKGRDLHTKVAIVIALGPSVIFRHGPQGDQYLTQFREALHAHTRCSGC